MIIFPDSFEKNPLNNIYRVNMKRLSLLTRNLQSSRREKNKLKVQCNNSFNEVIDKGW